ncbi:MAG: prepilin-type N-terminal cleavage/methylation domain-containing protein [Patescibacteria group bacterium]
MHTLKTNTKSGFTLLETIIYFALFGFLIIGGFLAAYQIIESSHRIADKTAREAEADFILRKIDWVLEFDATPAFVLDDGVLELDGDPLTTDNVEITAFSMTNIGGTPPAVRIEFEIDGVPFGPTIRYIR